MDLAARLQRFSVAIAGRESNPVAISLCSIYGASRLLEIVDQGGIEPPTPAMRKQCSSAELLARQDVILT